MSHTLLKVSFLSGSMLKFPAKASPKICYRFMLKTCFTLQEFDAQDVSSLRLMRVSVFSFIWKLWI